MIDLTPHLPALQVVVPMVSAPLVMLLRPTGLAWAAATLASFMAFLIAVLLTQQVLAGAIPDYLMGNWPAPFGIELRVDAFSTILLLVLTAASTLTLLASKKNLDYQIEDARQPLYYSAWLLATAGLAGILVTADAFNIFVFMEISSLASYILVAGGPDRRAMPAVFKYLIMGTVGATFYLIGVGLIYLMTGTLNLADMELRIHDVSDQRPILVAAGFITVGLALKAAVFPLHVWLPNAYTYAPHVVTAFLAACATKVSLYVLLRFDFIVFQPNLLGHDIQFAYFLMPLGVLAVLVASAVALFEANLKRMLAWSSVAQIGYIILGASMLSSTGLTASILHMFNHGLAKGGLFLAVACLAVACNGTRIVNFAGQGKRFPWVLGAFVIVGLSLIGVPGTAGFISKWYLITGALELGTRGVVLTGIIVLSSLMAVAYIWRVVEVIYFDAAAGESTESVRPVPRLLLWVTLLVAAMNIWFGIFPELPISLASEAAQILLTGSVSP